MPVIDACDDISTIEPGTPVFIRFLTTYRVKLIMAFTLVENNLQVIERIMKRLSHSPQ